MVSGENYSVQLHSEVRCLSRTERQEFLKTANLPLIIPTDRSFAIKADLAIWQIENNSKVK